MRAWIRLKLLYPVIKFPFTCCKILFIIWADTKVVLWELYPQGVIWTVFMCCVNKKICLPVKKVNSRGRLLPRYGFFSCAIFFCLFLFHVSIMFFYTLERKIAIRVGSKLEKWQFWLWLGTWKLPTPNTSVLCWRPFNRRVATVYLAQSRLKPFMTLIWPYHNHKKCASPCWNGYFRWFVCCRKTLAIYLFGRWLQYSVENALQRTINYL